MATEDVWHMLNARSPCPTLLEGQEPKSVLYGDLFQECPLVIPKSTLRPHDLTCVLTTWSRVPIGLRPHVGSRVGGSHGHPSPRTL